jgi:uncharacterized protein YbjQ (UPF0145 family)
MKKMLAIAFSSLPVIGNAGFLGVYTTDYVPNCNVISSEPLSVTVYAQNTNVGMEKVYSDTKNSFIDFAKTKGANAIIGYRVFNLTSGGLYSGNAYISSAIEFTGVAVKLNCK